MERLGLGYKALRERNRGLIYCSLKGFLSGPYAHRTALDEVAQMLGGLAYMTGLPGRPMRAGSSVIDISGAMFGVIGVLAALSARRHSGEGRHVSSALFETTAFMVGQHIAQQGVLGEEPPPMSVRRSAWSVYDIFSSAEGERVFVGVVSDSLWRRFCAEFALDDLAADTAYASNEARLRHRDTLIPRLNALFSHMSTRELTARLDRAGVPFAPINKPIDLVGDPHLLQGDALLDVTLSDGRTIKLPALPLEFAGRKTTLRKDLPRPGSGAKDHLRELGVAAQTLAALERDGLLIAS